MGVGIVFPRPGLLRFLDGADRVSELPKLGAQEQEVGGTVEGLLD